MTAPSSTSIQTLMSEIIFHNPMETFKIPRSLGVANYRKLGAYF